MRIILKYFVGFFLLLLMITESVAELVVNIIEQVHKWIKELALALETIYNRLNEPDSRKNTKP